MNKVTRLNKYVVAGTILIVALFFFYGATQNYLFKISIPSPEIALTVPFLKKSGTAIENYVRKFESAESFHEYTSNASSLSYGSNGEIFFGADSTMLERRSMTSLDVQSPNKDDAKRFSTTNVQVVGIDEPDVVKNDDHTIFISHDAPMYRMDPIFMQDMKRGLYPTRSSTTRSVHAFPPSEIAMNAEIPKSGNMLLSEKKLVVFTAEGLYAYDVIDEKKPKKMWEYRYADSSGLVDARLLNGMLYIVVRTGIVNRGPCSFGIMKNDFESVNVICTDIYHPIRTVSSDSVYTAIRIDPADGKAEKSVSTIGSSSETAFYMSENFLYIAYAKPGDMSAMMAGFVSENKKMFPQWAVKRFEQLALYELGDAARMAEMEELFRKMKLTLDSDEQMRFENEVRNGMKKYAQEHKRDFEKTIIAKFDIADMILKYAGDAPGRFLNQFSFDEFGGNLRVATTRGASWWNLGGMAFDQQESVNDVYILDKSLKQVGSVEDLGKGERIYAVRFMGEKGFVVTFRETDPLYALDLSDPLKPKLKGELKIPGYSAYLHPIGKNELIGVGKEGQNVKVSIFDVSDLKNPLEKAKYDLNEYWSDALSTHRAFLVDEKHQIFFIPGSSGGYVFSYARDSLELKAMLNEVNVKRAIYMDDYLYIISDGGITVYDETTWKKVNTIEFEAYSDRVSPLDGE